MHERPLLFRSHHHSRPNLEHLASHTLHFALLPCVLNWYSGSPRGLLLTSNCAAKVVCVFYRQNRAFDRFLQSDGASISRTNYIRVLALASVDVLLTLPQGVLSLVLFVLSGVGRGPLPFYQGWVYVHTNWGPEAISYAKIQAGGTANLAQVYFQRWSSPVLVFAIFGLFGVTMEARASYRRLLQTVGVWSRLTTQTDTRQTVTRATLSTLNFASNPHATLLDVELGLILYLFLLKYFL